MKNKFTFIFASTALILAMLACNAPAAQTPAPDLALTITAQALLIPQTGAQATGTPAPNQTQPSAPTASPSAPMADVSQNTNCRTGPGTAYDIVTSLNIGQQAVVVGKDTPDSYWIVNNPNGSGTCWLWGQYVSITGDPTSLPEMAPPAITASTMTPIATSSSGSGSGSFPVNGKIQCQYMKSGSYWQLTIAITWNSVNNAASYKIFRNGSLTQTNSGNSNTQFFDSLASSEPSNKHPSVSYSIQALDGSDAVLSTANKKLKCP